MFKFATIFNLEEKQKLVEGKTIFDTVRILPCYRDWKSYKWLEQKLGITFFDLDKESHAGVPWIQRIEETLVIVVKSGITAPPEFENLEFLPVLDLQNMTWKGQANKFMENNIDFLEKAELVVADEPRKIGSAAHGLDFPGR